MDIKTKFQVSKFINILLLVFAAFLVLALCLVIFYEPEREHLPHDFTIYKQSSIISGSTIDVHYDEYINFDNYIVVKKRYDGKQMFNNDSEEIDSIQINPESVNRCDTLPLVIGEDYYFIINKRNNELEGPLVYKDFIANCLKKGLYLF